MTLPAATVGLVVFVIVPTMSLAATMLVCASACACPTTLGTVTGGGPSETVRLTAEPGATLAPATGAWLMTLPAATVGLVVFVTVPTMSLAATMLVCASACALPTTLGTVTGAPRETVRLTADPGATLAPATGAWLMTLPQPPSGWWFL